MGLAWEIRRAGGNPTVDTKFTRSVDHPRFDDRGTIRVVATQVHPYKGVTRLPGAPYMMDPVDVATYLARQWIEVPETLPSPEWWLAKGRVLEILPQFSELPSKRLEPLAHSLRIVQGCDYDPGQAAFRFHSALNEHSDHVSAFVRYGDTNTYCSLRQWDGKYDLPMVRSLLLDADVVHSHVTYVLARNAGLGNRPRPEQLLIRHYHGSSPTGRQWPELQANIDDMLGATLVGARLTLCALRPGRIHWLPIPIPVDRYASLVPRERDPNRPFYVAHSPTRRDFKGTDVFERVIQRLRDRHINIQALMIEKRPMATGLQIKALADAVFDSFWLGIQGSGLEAAAMGIPVLAGDADVKTLYENEIGYCPYTFTPDEITLERELERLVVDSEYRQSEAQRVNAYVRQYHDYSAVAARYDEILRSVGVKLPPPKPHRLDPVVPPKSPKKKSVARKSTRRRS